MSVSLPLFFSSVPISLTLNSWWFYLVGRIFNMVGKLASRDSRLTSSHLNNSSRKRNFCVLKACIPTNPGKVLSGSTWVMHLSSGQLLWLQWMAHLWYVHIMVQRTRLLRITSHKEGVLTKRRTISWADQICSICHPLYSNHLQSLVIFQGLYISVYCSLFAQ